MRDAYAGLKPFSYIDQLNQYYLKEVNQKSGSTWDADEFVFEEINGKGSFSQMIFFGDDGKPRLSKWIKDLYSTMKTGEEDILTVLNMLKGNRQQNFFIYAYITTYQKKDLSVGTQTNLIISKDKPEIDEVKKDAHAHISKTSMNSALSKKVKEEEDDDEELPFS